MSYLVPMEKYVTVYLIKMFIRGQNKEYTFLYKSRKNEDVNICRRHSREQLQRVASRRARQLVVGADRGPGGVLWLGIQI